MIYSTLTYGIINTQLNNALANACLYGADVIAKLNEGIPCNAEKKRAQKILDLVDSILIYGQLIPNTPASCVYSTSNWTGGSSTFSLQLSFSVPVGGSNVYNVTGQTSITGAINAVVAAINAAVGSACCVYDSVNKQFVMNDPTNSGSSFNSVGIDWTAVGAGKPTIPSPFGTFSGGVTGNANTPYPSSGTCLAANQIESILDKLTKLGVLPCTTIENFN